MSLVLKLLILIVGITLIESNHQCITDCVYLTKEDLVSENGLYCAVNEWKEGYTPGNKNSGEWKKMISCTQDRPLIDGSQVPYLFKYRGSDKGFICNGRCGNWLNMTYLWCHNDDYNRYDPCYLHDFIYDVKNFWPNLQTYLNESLNSYKGYKKQLSFSPTYLGIEEKFNDIVAVAPKEFYQYNQSSTSDPVNKYITVYPPGSEWYDPRELTVAMSARIFLQHIRETDVNAKSDKTVNCCESFVSRSDDDVQVLLKYTLGGSFNSKNVIPLAAYSKNDGNGKITINEDVAFLGVVENIAYNFLKNNSVGYVDWTVLVHYGELIHDCRPIAFFYKFVFKNFDHTPYFFKDGLLIGQYQIEFIVNNNDPKYIDNWKNP